MRGCADSAPSSMHQPQIETCGRNLFTKRFGLKPGTPISCFRFHICGTGLAPFPPQLVQRAEARSLSLEASGPHRMTGTAHASAAYAGSAHTIATPKESLAVARRGSVVVPLRAYRAQGRGLVKQRYMLSVLCRCSTYKLMLLAHLTTWSIRILGMCRQYVCKRYCHGSIR